MNKNLWYDNVLGKLLHSSMGFKSTILYDTYKRTEKDSSKYMCEKYLEQS